MIRTQQGLVRYFNILTSFDFWLIFSDFLSRLSSLRRPQGCRRHGRHPGADRHLVRRPRPTRRPRPHFSGDLEERKSQSGRLQMSASISTRCPMVGQSSTSFAFLRSFFNEIIKCWPKVFTDNSVSYLKTSVRLIYTGDLRRRFQLGDFSIAISEPGQVLFLA